MQKQISLFKSINWPSLSKKATAGGFIALALISFFLSKVKHTDPSWPAYWYIRPLMIVSLAGAAAGVVYYFIDKLGSQLGWQKFIAVIAGLLVYVVALWMGTVLGLAGTLWD